MDERLVWNFEFANGKALKYPELLAMDAEEVKWEVRFFWSHDAIITLFNVDDALLDLTNYHQKHKEDFYFLVPDCNYNIKKRRNELLYKPVVQQHKEAIAFGPKIKLGHLKELNICDVKTIQHLEAILARTRTDGVQVFVRKEAFKFKFPTSPHVKLELARLEVRNEVYFSACIEGRSLYLVEKIREHLLGEHLSCDYVSFLKKIMQS